jgi:hypothetical protein
MQAESLYLASHGWDTKNLSSLAAEFLKASESYASRESAMLACARLYDDFSSPAAHKELQGTLKVLGESFTPWVRSVSSEMEAEGQNSGDAPRLLLSLCGGDICRTHTTMVNEISKSIHMLAEEAVRLLGPDQKESDGQVLSDGWGCEKCRLVFRDSKESGVKWVRTLQEGSHFDYGLLKCPACGQFFLRHWYEIWVGEGDLSTTNWAPVTKREAIQVDWMCQPGVSISSQDELLGSLIHRKIQEPPDEELVTDYRDPIIKEIAESTAKAISRKVILALQKMKDEMQSGDDTPLGNVWDEVCVQVQGEEFVFWDAYLDTIDSLLLDQVGKLSTALRKAIWLQTQNGTEWADHKESGELTRNEPQNCFYYDDDIVGYIRDTYLLSAAADWTNRRIEKYNDQSEGP